MCNTPFFFVSIAATLVAVVSTVCAMRERKLRKRAEREASDNEFTATWFQGSYYSECFSRDLERGRYDCLEDIVC